MKLYIVVKKTLGAGLKMAQACHAMALFRETFRDIYDRWYAESNNIVVLEEPDLEQLARSLEEQGYRNTLFLEPDLDDELTALCVEPDAWKQLSTLPLAG